MNFFMPTHIVFEKDAVKHSYNVFKQCGKHAFILSKDETEKKNPALKDVFEVLKSNNIEWTLCDKIQKNNSDKLIEDILNNAKDNKIDYVIAIGNSEILNIAKIIAFKAGLEDNTAFNIENNFSSGNISKLPLITIPDEAGSGSEVTPYSFLPCEKQFLKNDKVKFFTPDYALIDVSYLKNVSISMAASSVLESFINTFEGFISNNSNSLSDALALESFSSLNSCISELKIASDLHLSEIPENISEYLLYSSLLGGMVITQMGMGPVCVMSCCLSSYLHISRGLSAGLILRSFLKIAVDSVSIDTITKMKTAFSVLGYKVHTHVKGELLGQAKRDVLKIRIQNFIEDFDPILIKTEKLTEEQITDLTNCTLQYQDCLETATFAITEEIIRGIWAGI